MSLDAFQLSVADVEDTALAFKPPGGDGAAVSAHAAPVALTVAAADRFPAASSANTENELVLPQLSGTLNDAPTAEPSFNEPSKIS